jgi:integrase
MPKVPAKEFYEDIQVRKAKPKAGSVRTDFRIANCKSLVLRVTAGAKSWTYRYKSPITGSRTKLVLGTYPTVTLAAARTLAEDTARKVNGGADPLYDSQKRELVETFATLCERYMREHTAKNARGDKPSRWNIETQRVLDRDILPTLGRMKADAVKRTHVSEVIERIADRNALVAADNALKIVRTLFNWACSRGRLEHNPTLGLAKRNAMKPKDRVLSPDEIRIFWRFLDNDAGMSNGLRYALKLQLLTATRQGEILGVARKELDLDGGLWTIPAIRTKSDREHKLPLSPQAVSIFRDAITWADAEELRRSQRYGTPLALSVFVFPAAKAPAPVNSNAGTRAMDRNRAKLVLAGIVEPFNTHDLRRTVATQLGDLEFPDEVIERILNHAPRSTAGRHYNHAKHIEPMRRALETWGNRMQAIIGDPTATSNVVPLRRDAKGARK